MTNKDIKLSFVDNTTYYGKDLEGFYAVALLTGSSKSEFKLIPNVKSKVKLGELDLGNILAGADCSFSSTGEGTLSQKSFEVEPIKINLEYCQRTFEVNYLSELLRPGSNNDEIMPATVEQYLLSRAAEKISADTEKLVWQGDTATASYPLALADGLQKQFLADATVIDVTATASTISASNVIGELQRVYDAIPDTIIEAEDLTIFVTPAIYRAYRQALANASAEVNFMQNYAELHFLNIKLITANGLGAKKMVAARKSNLLLLTDLMSDFEDIQVLPQKSVTGVPVIRMIGEFKFGVGYIFGSEIVYYS
jgi:hypothetical protein